MSERTLTEQDITAITDALKVHPVCSLGLTTDEVSILKRVISAFDIAAGIVGKAVLMVIVLGIIGMFTKGFWMTLITGVKEGAGK
jgi:hypothetical protein